MSRSPLAPGLIAALALFTAPAHANDGAFYGQGATVFPVLDETIALESEVLAIEQGGPAVGYYVDHWKVEVTYRFRNTADRYVEVQMGFPEWCESTPESMDRAEGSPCPGWTIRDFTVQIDGKRGPKTRVKAAAPGEGPLADMAYGRVYTFPVRFGPGEVKTVRHTYEHATSLTSPWCSDLTYILRTGALWKGPIGRLDITVRTHADFASPPYATEWLQGTDGRPKPTITADPAGGQTLRWHAEAIEPAHDLSLTFCEPKAMIARSEAIAEVRALDEAALAAMDAERLRVLRNTVYAAYGYTFRSPELRAHFERQPWYRARADFDPKWLRPADVERVALIKKLEAKKKPGAAAAE